MKKTEIVLSSVKDVRDFVNMVILIGYDVDLMQGKYVIDAKSVMGIFALDLMTPITVIAHSDNTKEFFEKIERFKKK
ncbi:MAG: HPr family phosphocarrier protein [Ruminococcaceae bacterium]|nr:HPr family phosphocarrier protein [Oscillospiraceae bacterium]